MPNSVGCTRLRCDLPIVVLVWFSCFAGLRRHDVVVYWIEVGACQDTKDDGDGVEEIGVFMVENGGEDELSRVPSIVAIWVVDERTKEFSRWSEVARGGASMKQKEVDGIRVAAATSSSAHGGRNVVEVGDVSWKRSM
ncbi:hypothetical protein V8G54_004416 [Vigna mungo]|uniref:Uncharacterized protein n=1 Tax=Vigna mungo TaxID=3915 RepID=A0AAQ3PDS0_VIGMU